MHHVDRARTRSVWSTRPHAHRISTLPKTSPRLTRFTSPPSLPSRVSWVRAHSDPGLTLIASRVDLRVQKRAVSRSASSTAQIKPLLKHLRFTQILVGQLLDFINWLQSSLLPFLLLYLLLLLASLQLLFGNSDKRREKRIAWLLAQMQECSYGHFQIDQFQAWIVTNLRFIGNHLTILLHVSNLIPQEVRLRLPLIISSNYWSLSARWRHPAIQLSQIATTCNWTSIMSIEKSHKIHVTSALFDVPLKHLVTKSSVLQNSFINYRNISHVID